MDPSKIGSLVSRSQWSRHAPSPMTEAIHPRLMRSHTGQQRGAAWRASRGIAVAVGEDCRFFAEPLKVWRRQIVAIIRIVPAHVMSVQNHKVFGIRGSHPENLRRLQSRGTNPDALIQFAGSAADRKLWKFDRSPGADRQNATREKINCMTGCGLTLSEGRATFET